MLVLGVVFAGAGIYAFTQVQAGADSLQAFSEAQGVELSYNEDGVLIDRGSPEEGAAIIALVRDDWGYPVDMGDLDPDDPLVNTSSEYMVMMGTVGYHVMHGTQTVVLDEAVEYNGETFEPGVYEVEVSGRYWTGFDRSHPLDGAARGQAWTGTVHGLFGELGVGAVTANMLDLSTGLAAMILGLGLTLMALGGGLIWIGAAKEDDDRPVMADSAPKPEPATT
jgi:hypothetical protein